MKNSFILLIVALFIGIGCAEITRVTAMKTTEATGISFNKATVNAKITDLSAVEHKSYGFCYSTKGIPTIADSVITVGSSPKVGEFAVELKNMLAKTTYYVAAFVQENDAFVYGNSIQFETLVAPVPSVIINPAKDIGYSTAMIGGSILPNGTDSVTESGICWATIQNPTIADGKLVNSGKTSAFQYTVSALKSGTKYYFRIYAKNSAGIGYSENLEVNTIPFALPQLSIPIVNEIKDVSVRCNGSLENIGDGSVSSLGICYSKNDNPTLETGDTIKGAYYGYGNGSGIYIVITKLTPKTTYYCRFYARNAGGVGYGKTVSFTTSDLLVLPTVAIVAKNDNDNYSFNFTVTLTSSGGGVDEMGYIYATDPLPIIKGNNYYSSNNQPLEMVDGKLAYSFFVSGTTYYVRAFAKNSAGISYSSSLSFVAKKPSAPTVTTATIFRVVATSAHLVGQELPWLNYQGTTSYGAVWNETGDPMVGDGASFADSLYVPAQTSYGEVKLRNLKPNTRYYARFWARNKYGYSYGNAIPFTTLSSSSVVKDYDGNEYGTVTIGTQTWLRENLNTKHYSNGVTIPGTQVYNYDERNRDYYGMLYAPLSTLYNTNQGGCPDGWHIPSKTDWETLVTYLGGVQIAGNKLKEAGTMHWFGDNFSTNSSGFTAITASGGVYSKTGKWLNGANYLSSTPTTNDYVFSVGLEGGASTLLYSEMKINSDLISIRCIKN